MYDVDVECGVWPECFYSHHSSSLHHTECKLWIFSRHNLIDVAMMHSTFHNTRNIIHLPAWGRVLFILYNSLPLPFRFGAVWAIGGLCVSRGLSQETISAVCYPIMRTKDQHSHQITPALSVEAENKTPARLPAWLDWSENLAHPTSNQLQTRLKLWQKHQKCFKISSSE